MIILLPKGKFSTSSLSLNIKNRPFIQDKAIAAKNLIIMNIVRKTFGLYENDLKKSSIKLGHSSKIIGFGWLECLFLHLIPDATASKFTVWRMAAIA